jgi:Beta-lactamase enzyme family
VIRRSDNTAATRVVAIVGERRLVALARRVGMRSFRPASIWGLSQTTADDQARYFLRIDSYVAPAHRVWALGQLASIIRAQRWGIGRVPLAGWSLYFKGGWGSGTGRVDNQVALLVHGCSRVSVAVMTMDDGTHAYGTQTLYGVMVRLLARLPRYPHPTGAG